MITPDQKKQADATRWDMTQTEATLADRVVGVCDQHLLKNDGYSVPWSVVQIVLKIRGRYRRPVVMAEVKRRYGLAGWDVTDVRDPRDGGEPAYLLFEEKKPVHVGSMKVSGGAEGISL